MRIGTNPEKQNVKELIHKPHRVIIPVYIPNLEEEYFKNALEVLKICLDSLLATTNPEQTNITVINNNSCAEVNEVLEKYFQEGHIEKYVKRNENRGKVEPILSEAIASYEEFITIADADVFFRKGWLENTMAIFNNYKKAGVVSPIPSPHLYSYCNRVCVSDNFCKKRLHYSSLVDIETLKEFEKSVGSNLMHRFYLKQYYLEDSKKKAVLGAVHFVATYKNYFKILADGKKVSKVFENGLEKEFIDVLAEKAGLWRLSTEKSFVYHMGNSIYNFEKVQASPSEYIFNRKEYLILRPLNKYIYMIKKICGKIGIKYMKRKIKDTNVYNS